jgi:AcrR family transcriptional regulator
MPTSNSGLRGTIARARRGRTGDFAGIQRRLVLQDWRAMPARKTTTRTPRTGRRPGASGSREAILAAATRLFAEHGYVDTSLRAIAAEAGVDAALIIHFFESKANLLTAAVKWPFDAETEMARITARGRRHAGDGLVRLVVQTWDREGDRNAIMTLLRAAAVEPAAADLVRDFMQRELFPPLLRRLKPSQPELRANLVASQLVGLGIARYVLRFQPLAAMSEDEVVDWVAPTIQRYLTGRNPSARHAPAPSAS